MTDRRIYRAKWLLRDPWTVIENGYVQVAGGVIFAVGSGKPPKDDPVIDLGPGVMMAPCVNAHTHLELSALKGALPFDMGFRHWTAELIRKRAELSEAALVESAGAAIGALPDQGCRVVADISTLGLTRELLRTSPLAGFFFQEHLGSVVPDILPVEKADTFSTSLAAHAPHTTAPALFRAIKQATSSKGIPMSVHLGESEDEFLFVQSGRGAWADFLTERNIDFSDWPLPSKSPVQYLNTLDVLDADTLAVHLLFCSGEDMQLLQKNNVTVCFCPRSNFLLHGKLPDISSFLALGFKPCLGTDSLASAPSLSILDEMAFISTHYDSISPQDIIAMGTVYGATALGLGEKFGRLASGFMAPPFYIPMEMDSARAVQLAIVTSANSDLTDITEKPEKNDTHIPY